MKNYFISLNQFAEFSKGTLATKKRIIKQQLAPNKLLLPWYQKAKSAIKKYFKDIDDTTPIEEAITILTNKTVTTQRQQNDRKVSIEALNQLKTFAFPKILRDVEFEIIKPEAKNLYINQVSILIAPDVILKGFYNGQEIYGAIKIHICKSKPFDDKQSKYVSSLLYKYVTKKVAKGNGIALPEICICLDIFGGRITPASSKSTKENLEIKNICEELKMIWTV